MEDTQTAAAPVTTDTPAPAADLNTAPDDSGNFNPDAALDAAILARLEESGATEGEDDAPPAKVEQETDAPPAEIPTPTETETEDDALAKELGIDPTKNNRIPYAKVKKILANTEKRLTEAHTAALSERDTKLQTHEQRLAQVDSVEKIMASEPERFLQLLVDVNPAYANLIGQKTSAAAQVTGDDAEPPPDYPLGDGKFTYSVEGLQKRDAWRDRQTEARIFKRLDPILKRHEAEERIAAEGPRVQKELQRLQARPYFMENIDAIHAKVREGMPADEAYWTVVSPQLIADRNAIRAELIKEQQGLPRSTSVGVVSTSPKPDAESDLNSRILANLKNMPKD